MIPILENCDDPEVDELLQEVRESYHPTLDDFNVSIRTLKASRRMDKDGSFVDGAVLALRGFECAAIIRSSSYQERVLGVEDVVLVINWEHWQDLDREQRLSLIDHELTHIEIARDKQNTPLYDDLDRPRLKMRRHDFEIGGFSECVERHGRNAVEAVSVRSVSLSRAFKTQQVFEWADFEEDSAVAAETGDSAGGDEAAQVESAVARVEAGRGKQRAKKSPATKAALAPAYESSVEFSGDMKALKKVNDRGLIGTLFVDGKDAGKFSPGAAAEFIVAECKKKFTRQRRTKR